MFHIIKEVNGSVDANDLAIIKRIDHVAFGREARIQLGELQLHDPRLAGITLDAAAAASTTTNYDSGMMNDRGGDDAAGVDADGFDKLGSYSPYHGRYVDVNFVPLHADVVRQVLDGKELPGDNLELVVAKRVPVRIALRMNERNIPEFMTACANSPFAFEINQVRMNRHEPGEGIEFNGGGYGEDNSAGGGSPEGGSREGMSDGMAGIDFGAREGEGGDVSNLSEMPTNVEVRTNYDVDVEFYGIVKIYNPVTPDRIKLLRKSAGLSEEVDPNDAAKKSTATDVGNSKP